MRRLALIALLVACGKASPPAPTSRDALIAAWKQAGLTVSSFAATQSAIGKDCQAGTVNKLDVLVCSYASPDDAKAAESGGLQWVGDTTGAAQAHGAILIAVADRHKADPNGKTINQILKAH
ncbi:MAG TPA: hypothetical protein VGG74_30040 [Kofleriaceae bacterium]|jgi:hypothetical protein